MIKKFLFFSFHHSSRWVDGSLFLLRVFTGLVMAFGHGIGKFPPSEKFIEGVSEMGLPFPVFFGWSASISEFIGGMLLAAGFLTRPASILIALTMGVAAFIRHAPDPFSTKEKALLYIFICILFAIVGSGKYGIDSLLQKKK